MRPLKIIFLIRSNVFTQRGGDTVVVEKTSEELTKLGHHVTIDIEEKCDPKEFDIAHLYNFATPEITEKLAIRCYQRGTPFVVTTLYEDWPRFFLPMLVSDYFYSCYLNANQPQNLWPQVEQLLKTVPQGPVQGNYFTAKAANILLASGEHEAAVLDRDYQCKERVEVCYFGSDISPFSDGGELFRAEVAGKSDYLLCVGRLELRKNQLSLIKALDESSLPIVFATGGFTYQPEYEALCRKLKRKGRNIFLSRISFELLASAYEGALAHVLPSWYELPGLVSIEAAARGTRVVASDWGTIKDYLKDGAHYCEPNNTSSILNSVNLSISNPVNPALRQLGNSYNWSNCGKRTEEIYEIALSRSRPTVDYVPKEPVLNVKKESIPPEMLPTIKAILAEGYQLLISKETN